MQTQDNKVFHIGDLLSITTSMLVSPRYMDGVYEIISYLTEGAPALDSLEAELTRCRPYVLRLYPDLADIDTVDVAFENWRAWLEEQAARFGQFLPVAKPRAGELDT